MRGHREIKGFPGYWISWKGHVFSESIQDYLPEKFNPKGYLRVCLYIKGGWGNRFRKWKYLHRLSCEAYNKNPDPARYTQVHHKKFNKLKNGAKDVMWCTPQQNHDFNKQRMRIMAQEARKERERKGILDPF